MRLSSVQQLFVVAQKLVHHQWTSTNENIEWSCTKIETPSEWIVTDEWSCCWCLRYSSHLSSLLQRSVVTIFKSLVRWEREGGTLSMSCLVCVPLVEKTPESISYSDRSLSILVFCRGRLASLDANGRAFALGRLQIGFSKNNRTRRGKEDNVRSIAVVVAVVLSFCSWLVCLTESIEQREFPLTLIDRSVGRVGNEERAKGISRKLEFLLPIQ